MVKALPNTSFLPVPKSAPSGHTTAAAHLLWQVFPRYPCLEYKNNSGQSCPVRYTWTASFGRGLMFWQKWFNLTPQFVAYQLPGHLLHRHWYFTAYSSICQVLLERVWKPQVIVSFYQKRGAYCAWKAWNTGEILRFSFWYLPFWGEWFGNMEVLKQTLGCIWKLKNGQKSVKKTRKRHKRILS